MGRLIAWLGTIAALAAACSSGASASNQASQAASTPGNQQKLGQITSNKPLPPTVCERKIITTDDISSLLPSPITPRPLSGDPQSCVFDGGNFTKITISVRPGLGDVSVNAWATGQMPIPGVTVNGIGDRAVWQDMLRELIATRHNVLCDIGSTGVPGTAAELQKTFAALCNKIWAAQ
jgi:hypothetical protein